MFSGFTGVCVLGGCSHPPHLSLSIAMIACKHMHGYRYHRRLAAEVVVVVVAGASVAQSEGRKGRARELGMKECSGAIY